MYRIEQIKQFGLFHKGDEQRSRNAAHKYVGFSKVNRGNYCGEFSTGGTDPKVPPFASQVGIDFPCFVKVKGLHVVGACPPVCTDENE